MKQVEADLVIIGGGGAGLPAALTALDNGVKSIIVLEKLFAPGGDALRCNHIFAVGTHLQKEAGVTITADEIYKKALEWHHYDRVKPRILRALINKTADDIHWIESKGAEFKLLLTMSPDPKTATTHVEKDIPMPDSLCSLGKVFRLLFRKCKEGGVRFFFHTSGKKILRGADGKISGVIAADKKGNEYSIKAKSVILCTGSFLGNKKLLMKYFPLYYNDAVHHDALASNTGDGIQMASDVGAGMTDYCTLIRHGGDSFDRESMYIPSGASSDPTSIRLNTLGQRFLDEGTHEISGNVLAQQPGKIGFAIYDEEMLQAVMNRPMMMTKQARIPIPPEKRIKLKQYLEMKDKEGVWVKIAGNWDGIAKWIGCDPGVLQETVEQYNSFCDKGYDEDFAKDKKFLVPLRNPPYYAVKFRPLMIETVGPVVVNERMEVLDKKDEKPIPGFFAAGVITSGWESNDYGGTPGGTALSFSIASGRIAAESAAKYMLGKNI